MRSDWLWLKHRIHDSQRTINETLKNKKTSMVSEISLEVKVPLINLEFNAKGPHSGRMEWSNVLWPPHLCHGYAHICAYTYVVIHTICILLNCYKNYTNTIHGTKKLFLLPQHHNFHPVFLKVVQWFDPDSKIEIYARLWILFMKNYSFLYMDICLWKIKESMTRKHNLVVFLPC